MPFHPTFTGLENAEALIFMDCGGHDRWVLANDSLANDFRIDTITYGIMNQPAARKQLRGELADILDAHEVREDVMTLRWLRVIAKVHGAHGNTDSFSLAVVKCPRGHDCKLNIATAKNEPRRRLNRRLANLQHRAYQITGRTESGRTIASPGLQPKAAANSGRFDSGPFVLQRDGECGSVLMRRRIASGVEFDLQICAHARKKRCSGVKPSMSGGRPFCESAFSSAAYAIDRPPRSARFSPSVSFPLTCTESSTVYASNCDATRPVPFLNLSRSDVVHQFFRLPCASNWAP